MTTKICNDSICYACYKFKHLSLEQLKELLRLLSSKDDREYGVTVFLSGNVYRDMMLVRKAIEHRKES
jgi:hypothetical protein